MRLQHETGVFGLICQESASVTQKLLINKGR